MMSSKLLAGRDKQILHIALPAIISNVTVPLLGLVDVAIVGHLGAASYIAAIAIGGMIFNVIYWVFGFLRMGTSGFTSQALGRRDLGEVVRVLVRSLGVALGVALVLMVLQQPILDVALRLLNASADARPLASSYFRILIWGAPAMLGLFGLTGWFIGMQNSRVPMAVSITQNVVNIFVSVLLVFGLRWRVEGVATGTLVAQWAGFLMALLLCLRHYGRLHRYFSWRGVWTRVAMLRFFRVNTDIFLRTMVLVTTMLVFTSAGSRFGDVTLAVNTLLMQFYLLFSYVMDGFAYAGEALSGRYRGAQNHAAFSQTVTRLFRWGWLMAIGFTLVYAAGGSALLSLLTDELAVVAAAGDYRWWAVVIPVLSMAAFVWDGVFIGCTLTRSMLLSMCVATSTFFILLYLSIDFGWANHGLWLAFVSYLAMRGCVQWGLFRRWARIQYSTEILKKAK